MTELNDKVLEAIKSESVVMRPRSFFVLKTGLIATGGLLALLLSLYALSFVFFIFRETGIGYLPHFGGIGILWFIITSPWILIGITGAFLGTLYLLIRHFSFGYKQPAIYTIIALVLVAIAGASIMEYVAMHDKVRQFSRVNNLSAVDRLYEYHIPNRPDRAIPGVITDTNPSNITITTPRNEVLLITISEKTRLPKEPLVIGQHVFVFGPRVGTSSVEAIGVKPIEGNRFLRQPERRSE